MCNDILSLLKDHLIKDASNSEGEVFYKKMEGDYHRYIAEFSKGSERENAKVEAERSYQASLICAQENLDPTHPIRLGLALNFSVFHYEILGDNEKACEMAK